MKEASAKDLTLLRKLKQRKYRDQERLFVVEGSRAIEQTIEGRRIEVIKIFVIEGKEIGDDYPVPAFILNKKDAKELFDTDSPQGVIAICKMPEETLVWDLADHSGLIIAFDRIQDPGNAGTMMRTAAWFGVSGVLLGKGTVDIFNSKVVRSTMGALGVIPFMHGNLSSLLALFESKGWKVVLLDGNKGSKPLQRFKKTEKIILVVGNEANGIDKELKKAHRERALITSAGTSREVESLNASIALSIGLYHFCSS